MAVVQIDKTARTPAYAAIVSSFEALELCKAGKDNAKLVQIEMVVRYTLPLEYTTIQPADVRFSACTSCENDPPLFMARSSGNEELHSPGNQQAKSMA